MGMNEDAAAIIYSNAKAGIEQFANELYASRKAAAASVCQSSEEQAAVVNSENTTYSLSLEGSSMVLSENEVEDSLAVQLVEEGKPTPYTKGPGGTATNIDGSTYKSRSIIEGVPLPWYAWPATHFKEETGTMLQTTAPEMFDGYASESNSAIGEQIVKPYLEEKLSSAIGGGS